MVDWVTIPEGMQYDRVAVIGGGLSLKGVDLSPLMNGVYTITANSVWKGVPFANAVCSIDTSKFIKSFMDCEIPIFAAVPENFGSPDAKFACDRQTPLHWVHYMKRCNANSGLSEKRDTITAGRCSGFGAFNLAYHLRPKKILLLGIDLVDWGLHWFNKPKAEQKRSASWIATRGFNFVPTFFQSTIPQLNKAGIEVVNGSTRSLIRCFPKVSPEEGIGWLLS